MGGEAPPAGILDLFSGSNEKYVTVFVKAAIQFRDKKWAQVYLEHRDTFYAELLNLLSPEQRETYCLRHFKQYADFIVQQAREWPGEWSFVLAREIVTHTSKQPYQYNISFYKANIARIPATIAGSVRGAGLAFAEASRHGLGPLQILAIRGSELGLTSPAHFFWASGSLSSVLDNAPTYLVFFKAAQSLPKNPQTVAVAGLDPLVLAAISLGSVFMGAMTYIGNGPNFMVRSIAESTGVKMPSFFGYMVYSFAILLPILALTVWRFLM